MLFNEYRKYKEIILVDTENVSYSHPKALPKHTLVIFFISDPNLLSKFSFNKGVDNYKIVNIAHAAADGIFMKKNAMDFAIVSHISFLSSKMSKKSKMVILSADKDYDVSIYYINQLHNRNIVSRFSGNLNMYLKVDKGKQLSPVEEQIKSFHTYKRKLKPSEKKQLQKDRCILEDGKALFVEYDPVHDAYYLVYSGTYLDMRWSYEEIKTLYDNFVNESNKELVEDVVVKNCNAMKNVFYGVD